MNVYTFYKISYSMVDDVNLCITFLYGNVCVVRFFLSYGG